jgi:hypothetical protein
MSQIAADAVEKNAVKENMSAPVACQLLMELANARMPRPTPSFLFSCLDPARWRAVLLACNLLDDHLPLIHHLIFGFSYNSSISTNTSRIHPNLRSAIDDPSAVLDIFNKEVERGRYLGPFSFDQIEFLLGRPFISHPVGLVNKSNGKKRLVENLSFPYLPDDPSLNSLTSHADFSLNWGGFKDAVHLVVTAPHGSQGATIDWKEAFRTLGIRPDEWWMGIVHLDDRAWIDRCSKFGAQISSFNFELVAAAFAAIFHFVFSSGLLIYWVDDDLIRRIPSNISPHPSPLPPWSYSFSIDDVVNLGSALNAVFPPEKRHDFSFTSRYIGYSWHWDTKEVKLPEDKRISTRDLAISLLSTPFIHLDDVRSLIGKLGHCAMVLPLGRKHLRSLYALQTQMEKSPYSNSRSRWKWGHLQRGDLSWWLASLNTPDIGMKLCSHITPSDAFSLFTDASSLYGVGIIINDKFDLFKLCDDWQNSGEDTRDIGWAEFVAIELIVYFVLSTYNLHDVHLLVHTDNQGVIGAWAKRSSRSPEQNEVLGRILSLLLPRACFLSLEYVPSADNPADSPSRGRSPVGFFRNSFSGFPKNLVNVLRRPVGPLI